ncbi:unnamed protein product, partial [Effrenium voratum]
VIQEEIDTSSSAMELAKLIAPDGPWGKAWLAAHWERKLKKQDYLEVDLRSLLASISKRRSLVSLRATGHLLVGACKIYTKKCSFFEEEADEVRQALMMAFSRPEQGKELAPQIREVKAPVLIAGDQVLLGGKKHMARLEDITLKHPAKEPSVPIEDNDDLFGSFSQMDLEEVMQAVRQEVLPEDALEDLGKAPISDLDFDTLPLVALTGGPAPVEPEQDEVGAELEAGGDEVPMDLDADDEATPAPAHTSPVPLAQ